MQGSQTPLDVVARFRAHYLYSGNASASAREVCIPESTGRDLAQAATADPEFVELRRRVCAQEFEESRMAVRRVREIALERLESATGGIEVKQYGENVTVTDKRHEYGKLVIEAEKNAHHRARFDAELSGQIRAPGDVTIVVRGPDTDPAPPPPKTVDHHHV